MKKTRERKPINIQSVVLKVLPFIVPVVFFATALFTLYDYGMNWDSPVHFSRGHAFLRYFLTGNKDYFDMPNLCMGNDGFHSSVDFTTGEVCDRRRPVRRSEMQSWLLDYKFYTEDSEPYGHAPLSDIFLALSNYIFFIKLGWVEDVPSHHLYPIFMTFLLAGTVSLWTKRVVGTFGGVVAGLIVSLFPLLLGEQHFNVKDPIIASSFLIGIYLFWLSIVTKRARLMYISAVVGAISFATKINYVFAPVILFPWVLAYVGLPLWKEYKEKGLTIKKGLSLFIGLIPVRIICAIILYPFIVFAIFYATWPLLWSDPVHNLVRFFTYYKDIGTTPCPHAVLTPSWLFQCSNPTTILYILTTVPIISLALFSLGILYSPKIWKKAHYSFVLWVSFFVFTVLRVTLPGSAIYGGLRHIMEFIGPFAMIAGVGGAVLLKIITHIINKVTGRKYDSLSISFVSAVLIVCLFIPIVVQMINMHPNQNVFYNSFIGGLRGAKEKNFYGYANTYGNSYFQAVKWLNANAPKDSKLSLIWGLNQNITRGSERPDITHLGVSRSGYAQLGEYLLSTQEYGLPIYGTFRYKYADQFLRPVYVEEVDGVPLLKIWKNEAKYIKPGLNLTNEVLVAYVPTMKEEFVKMLLLRFENPVDLKRIEYIFESEECMLKSIGTQTYISPDGINISRIPDEINDFTTEEIGIFKGDLSYLFAGDRAVALQLVFPPEYPCDVEKIGINVFAFKDLNTTD